MSWNSVVNDLDMSLTDLNEKYYLAVQHIYQQRIHVGDRLWKITRRTYQHFRNQYVPLNEKLNELNEIVNTKDAVLQAKMEEFTREQKRLVRANLEEQIEVAKSDMLDIIEEVEIGLQADFGDRLSKLETDVSDIWGWMDEEFYPVIEEINMQIEYNTAAIQIINDVDMPAVDDRLTLLYEDLMASISNSIAEYRSLNAELDAKVTAELEAQKDEYTQQIADCNHYIYASKQELYTEIRLQTDDIYFTIDDSFDVLLSYINNEIDAVESQFNDPEQQLAWALNISKHKWKVIDDNLKHIIINALT